MKIGTEQIAVFKGMMREFADAKALRVNFRTLDNGREDKIYMYEPVSRISKDYVIEWDNAPMNIYGLFKYIVDDFDTIIARKSYEKASRSYDNAIEECVRNDIQMTKNIYKYKSLANSLYGAPQFTCTVPGIDDVIFNNPAIIVFWTDGTKTVVKADNEEFDPEKGLAMAIAKKALGNKHDYYETFKKWIGKYNKKKAKEIQQ